MKKAVLVCTFILAFATASFAQSGGTFGARVGANFSKVTFEDPEAPSTNTQTGLVAGVFGTVPVSGRFSFQPELLFSQQGAEAEDGEETGKIKLNYVNVPLLGNINLSTGGGDASFSLLLGPQIGFRTSAEFESAAGTEDLKDDTEKMDVALVGGIAATIRNFVIDARYAHGLRNLATDSEEGDIKNRVFSISVGIIFR